MKSLVVYYSRTGTTKKIAQAIARNLGGDIEEIIDKKDRRGPTNYLIAGKDAATKRLTEIDDTKKDISSYDIVVIGTPVWAFTMAPAIRTFITRHKESLKNIAFFCTQGGAGSKRTFKDMEELCGKRPVEVLEATTKEVMKDMFKQKISEFIERLSNK
ncbi:MAG: NAD(P)H-dependent oxidoreductase [Candidatus Omnitrophica bacterium]|nr:NAD(P)H-dependent oxidoreductase [Candidatus Omnitrophota bacterium]